MLTLEPLDNHANPAFKNPSSCKKWLDQLQLTNIQGAHATLRTQLEEFNRYKIRGSDRLQVLEMLREMVAYMQNDYGKRLSGKALPLDKIEMAFLSAAADLWHAMFTGYLRCVQAYQDGERGLSSQGALLFHRCMLYGGREIFEYLRAGYEFDGTLWQQLHALYALAENDGLLETEVEDEQDEYARRSTCRSLYLRNLLACHAHPQELTHAQQHLMQVWLTRWTPAITVDRTFLISKGDAPPLAIDLSGTTCLQPVRQDSPENGEDSNMRYLAMIPVSKLMRVKTILLQQGNTPKQVELDDGVNDLDCIELLTYLHKQWCEVRPERAHDRYGAAQEITISYGLENGYSFVANRPFNPTRSTVREVWRTEDISMLGARAIRPETSGVRLGSNRIIAAQITGDSEFKIGIIVWVNVTRTGQLRTGIRFLPGVPQAVSVKDLVTLPGTPNNMIAGMLLPAIEHLGIPASLIIPRNQFKPDRVLEVTIPATNETMRVKLKFSVEKGADYERVSFTRE